MPSTPFPRWGLLAAFLGSFVALLDLTIVIVALPAIQDALGADLVGSQWIVDSFALLMGAFLLSGGLLGDRFGRKRVYLIAIGVFVAGSLLCAFATGIGLLIAGRAVQGLAAAVIVPGSLSLIGRAAPDPAARGRLMGIWGMVASLAVVAGPLLGGVLVDSLGWEAIFWVNLPIGIVAIVCGLIGLAESADPQHASFDPAGQLLGVLALGALAYGAIESRDLPANAGAVFTASAVFVAATIAFILVERRVARPMLPLELFRNRQFTVVNAASVALGFGANGAFFLITLYLQQIRGNSALEAGLLLLPMTLAIVPASFLAGRLIAARGPRLPLVIGYLLTGASLAALASIDLLDAGYWVIGALFVICGIGQGLAIVPAPAAVLQTVPRERSGVGSAVVSTARQIGTALGFAILGTIVTAHVADAAPDRLAAAFVDGLRISLITAAALVLLAAVGLALIRHRDDGTAALLHSTAPDTAGAPAGEEP